MKFAPVIFIAVLLCGLHGIEGLGEMPPSFVRLERMKRFLCAGTPIDDHWIIASAGCVRRGVDMVVMDECPDEPDKECVKKMRVDRVITHPHWDGKADNDIALVRIQEAVKGELQMKMANRQREQMALNEKSKCYSMDWNKKSGMDKQKVSMRWLGCERQMSGIRIDDSMCSVVKLDDCKGAEGNPTICMIGKRWYLFGIHAVEKAVGGRCYNGLTRVSRYLPWFRNVMHTVDETDVPTGGRCMPPHRGGQDPCRDENAECMPGFYSHRCQCVERYHVVNGVCEYMGGDVGGECTPMGTCWDPNSECDNTTTCACTERYHEQDGVCEYTRQTFREACFSDSDCEDDLLECRSPNTGYNLYCVCIVGYIWERSNVTCVKCPDGETSRRVDECQPRFAKDTTCTYTPWDWICQEGLVCAQQMGTDWNMMCQCPKTSKDDGEGCTPCPPNQGRSQSSGTTCVDLVGLDDACSDDGQCVEWAECNAGACDCYSRYRRNQAGDACVKVEKKAGAPCESNTTCDASKDLSCVDGVCACPPTMRASYDGACKALCPDGDTSTCRDKSSNSWDCFPICDGVEDCDAPAGVRSSYGKADEVCEQSYASNCISTLQCISGKGLVCDLSGLCVCDAGFQWDWSEARCVGSTR